MGRNDLSVAQFFSMLAGTTVIVAGAILLAEREFVSSLEEQSRLQVAREVTTDDAFVASR